MHIAKQMVRGALLLGLGACSEKAVSTAPTPASSASVEVAAVAPRPVAVSAPDASAVAPVDAHGTVTLVVEQVDAVCTDQSHTSHRIGFDVFLQVDPEDAPGFKPAKDFLFCPKPAGGEPHLGIWQNCSAFPSCSVIADETNPTKAGEVTGQLTLRCAKEEIVLRSDARQTTVKGSFGARVLAPTPMKVAPLKTRTRQAWVDC